MGVFEFLMNQHFSYYGRLFSFFLIIGVIAFIFFLLKLRMEFMKSIIISCIISLVFIVSIIWLSHSIYNKYNDRFVKKTVAKSEAESIFLEVSPLKNIDEAIMNFFRVTYNNRD